LRGSEAKMPMKEINGVWVFDLPPDTPTISASKVRRLLDESPRVDTCSTPMR